MSDRSYEILQIKIDGIENELSDFKEEVRSQLTEVKHRDETIREVTAALRENVVRLTVIAEKQDEKLDLISENQNHKLDTIKKEINEIKLNLNNSDSSDDNKWYRGMIENSGSFIMKLLVVALSILFGAKFSDFFK
ncbi:hypothetical protein [Marinicrinis sediminis]|uniref:DUF1640 domain-containing protein n=1 Tax=Marinicrinis sediminis TaxID=1652465 RepID=A0ABW5R9X0_9BACL